jgi:multiple sugar transport system ATP-binding protein
MASVTLSGVGKVFSGGTRAVTDLDLQIEPGELMVLVGPSGCGKTTTLRMTAGLEEISEGEIRIGDRVVNSLDPRQRDVAMVFQNYALYPHMSVYDNLAFPLRAHGLPRADVRARVESTVKLLGLEEVLKRKPRALSGGQRQRVAMGRAIVREPQVFLMDEPLSNLDAKLRAELRAEIAGLQRKLGVTTLYVTHDQLEAMTMGARIAVMREGVLQQVAPPQVVYDEPANLFVATFVGSPMMNLLSGRIEHDGDRFECVLGGQRLPLMETDPSPALARYAGGDVFVGIRPEHLGDPADDHRGRPRLRGRVRFVELLGAEQLVRVELPAEAAAAMNGASRPESNCAIVTARFPAHTDVDAGDQIEVAVATERLHYFDPATGNAIR